MHDWIFILENEEQFGKDCFTNEYSWEWVCLPEATHFLNGKEIPDYCKK
jgi:hypothetical protein